VEGSSFTGDFEGKMNYSGTCRKKLWRQVSLSLYRGMLGNLGGSLFKGNFKR
jgi:hypothetical protein